MSAEMTANVPALLERMAELSEKRTRVLQELQGVNDDIEKVYSDIDVELSRIRSEVGITKRPMSAERKLLQSAKLRTAHARKKRSGERWHNQYTKRSAKK